MIALEWHEPLKAAVALKGQRLRRLEMKHQALASFTTNDEHAELREPAQVLAHPDLSPDDQRAILASWASDANAIPDAPALRRLGCGTVVRLSDILLALKAVDERVGGNDGDDDDPPPVPAATAMPPALAHTRAMAA